MITLYLTGCMGAGKSTVGRALAEKLGRAFVDLDAQITAESGRTPAGLLDELGEDALRDAEAAALERVALADGRIVALGGGSLLRAKNRDRIRATGRLAYLRARADTLTRRATADTANVRPLLRGDALARMRALLSEREPLYAVADLVVDTDAEDANGVTSALARALLDMEKAAPASASAEHEPITVTLGSGAYPIYFSSGERHRLGERVRAHHPAAVRTALVTDDAVAARYRAEAEASLRAAGFEVVGAVVPAGEQSKSLATLSGLYDVMLGARLDRESPVVALGGGVVGDLAGFAAATLLRGVPLVQVPTTLLAQVDSSVGGKTGINHALGKNLIGAFHQPSLVFIDASYLSTLPLRDVRAGLAEVVKYGVMDDPALFEELERGAERLAAGDATLLLSVVRRSCEIKAGVVAADVFERTGRRALLNLGHTFGHAIEKLTGYGELRHGEAVAIGLCMAARVSSALGLAPPTVGARIASLLTRLQLPTAHDAPAGALAAAMGYDKKLLGARVHFILIEDIGRVRRVPLDPEEAVRHLRGQS